MAINLNQPSTLIFHPGIGKTATTAIQELGLRLNTDDPESACFSPFGVIGGAHNGLSSNHPLFNRSNFQTEWKKILEFANGRNACTVISSEFLIRDHPAHIKELIMSAKSSGLEIKVVVATRNYTDYLISAFLQAVKVNWGVPDNEDIFAFCERELAQIRMPLLADNWSRFIGDENVFLMDYDKEKENFVDLFFDSIGAQLANSNKKENIVNESIKIEIAPMLRHFDRISNDKEQRAELIKYLNTLNYNKQYAENIKKRIETSVVRNAFSHDKERLTARYTWI